MGNAYCTTTPIPLNSAISLQAQVLQGTAPFSYNWMIVRPDAGVITLPDSAGPHNYTLSQEGDYIVTMIVTDGCLQGGLTDSASCAVNVTAPCTLPSCGIIVS
jgi:hypothetical protein